MEFVDEYSGDEFEDYNVEVIDEDGYLLGGVVDNDYEEPSAVRKSRGRPRKYERKEQYIGIRLYDEEVDYLELIKEHEGMSNSQIMKNALRMYFGIRSGKW